MPTNRMSCVGAGMCGSLLIFLCAHAAADLTSSAEKDPLGTTAALPLGPMPSASATMAANMVGTAAASANAWSVSQIHPAMAAPPLQPSIDIAHLGSRPFRSLESVENGATAASAAAAVQAAASAVRDQASHLASTLGTQLPTSTQPNAVPQAAFAPQVTSAQDSATLGAPAQQVPVSLHREFGDGGFHIPHSHPNLAAAYTPERSLAASVNFAPSAYGPAVSHAGISPTAGVQAMYNNPPISAAPATAAAPAIEDRASSRLIRREPVPPRTGEIRIGEAVPGSDRYDDKPQRLGFQYKEDPQMTPEAIYANKKLAPDIAEFLGHLAKNRQARRGGGKHHEHGTDGVLAEGHHSFAESAGGSNDDDDEDNEDRVMMATKRLTANTALASFFDVIDSKNSAAAWLPGDCAALARNVSARYRAIAGQRSQGRWGFVGPATAHWRSTIHTGIFLQHWNIRKIQQAVRKLRLSVLSFLATQDALKLKLHIWTDLDKTDPLLQDLLGPLRSHPEMLDAINVTKFNPDQEFRKVPPTIARERLHERYEQDTMPMLRSDLYRAIILYNYGGLWMDADTILMQDVVPLMGEDWAYIARGKEGVVEGALLSSSAPFSHFSNQYLMNMIMREEPLFKEITNGVPKEDKSILDEMSDNDPDHLNFHVLPPCFIDADPAQREADAAVLASDATPDSSFFGRSTPSSYRDYFSAGIEEAEQEDNGNGNATSTAAAALELPAVQEEIMGRSFGKQEMSPSWAYHWRGNWDAPWRKGSFADIAERTFLKKLKIVRIAKYFS